MKFKTTILVLSCSIFVLTLDTDPDLQKNVFSLVMLSSINSKENYLILLIDFVVTKFQLLKLNDMPMILRKMPVDFDNYDDLSPSNITKYGYLWGDV